MQKTPDNSACGMWVQHGCDFPAPVPCVYVQGGRGVGKGCFWTAVGGLPAGPGRLEFWSQPHQVLAGGIPSQGLPLTYRISIRPSSGDCRRGVAKHHKHNQGPTLFPCCTWSVGRGSACLVVAWICKHERHEAMERSLIWRSGHVGSLPALRSVSQGNASILLGLGFFIWTREVLRPTSQNCQTDQMRWCVSCCQQTELLKSFSAAEGGGWGARLVSNHGTL